MIGPLKNALSDQRLKAKALVDVRALVWAKILTDGFWLLKKAFKAILRHVLLGE